MNFFNRVGGAIIVMLPPLLLATPLVYYAWNYRCDTLSCKVLTIIPMLTGVILVGWSLIVMIATYMAAGSGETPSPWELSRRNITLVIPFILFYSLLLGVMCYYSFIIIVKHVGSYRNEENQFSVLLAFFLPVYELTRIMERRKYLGPKDRNDLSENEPGSFYFHLIASLQTFVTYAIWYFLMLAIVSNKSLVFKYVPQKGLHYYIIVGVMGGVSYLLYKCFGQVEKQLRKNEILVWNSSYP